MKLSDLDTARDLQDVLTNRLKCLENLGPSAKISICVDGVKPGKGGCTSVHLYGDHLGMMKLILLGKIKETKFQLEGLGIEEIE